MSCLTQYMFVKIYSELHVSATLSHEISIFNNITFTIVNSLDVIILSPRVA